MKFSLSMIATIIIISANSAQASAAPTSTDEARAVAGRALPALRRSAATFPTNTDEARAGGGFAADPAAGQKAAAACPWSCACKRA